MFNNLKVCVIIPCYKVKDRIENVINNIDLKIVDKIFVVDDHCPEKTGQYLKEKIKNKKIEIIVLNKNLGVGGATKHGFSKALQQDFNFLFKIDGDGQHDPSQILEFLETLEKTNSNFCKGSRFMTQTEIKKIPLIRYFGNIILTKITEKNTNIKNLTDAVNGYLVVKSSILKKIDFTKISNDFFFEEDLLFHLSYHNINLCEVPIKTIYFEKSNLNPIKVIIPFLINHIKNYLKKKYDL